MGSNPASAGVDLGFKMYEFVNADALDNEQYVRAKARREAEAESAFSKNLEYLEMYIERWIEVWNYGNPNDADRRFLRHVLLRLSSRGAKWCLQFLNAFYPLHAFMKKPVSNDTSTQSRMKLKWEQF